MNKYMDFLTDTIKELQQEEASLIASSRKDEANFLRIKSNICDICKTIYSVHAKTKQGTELKTEYIRQLTRLQENWKISLEKATAHEDVEKIVIEEAKLEMLQKIQAKFEELGAWE